MRKFFGLQLMKVARQGRRRVSPFVPHNGVRLHLEIQLNICSSVTLLYIIIVIIIMVRFYYYHTLSLSSSPDEDADGDDCAASCVRFWGHSDAHWVKSQAIYLRALRAAYAQSKLFICSLQAEGIAIIIGSVPRARQTDEEKYRRTDG